jgi:hypothetical protein
VTFERILQLARANTAGLQWWETRCGYIRCEDDRCPLEAAAGVEPGNTHGAIMALQLDCHDPGARAVCSAADHRVAVPLLGIDPSRRGEMIMALGVAVRLRDRWRGAGA